MARPRVSLVIKPTFGVRQYLVERTPKFSKLFCSPVGEQGKAPVSQCQHLRFTTSIIDICITFLQFKCVWLIRYHDSIDLSTAFVNKTIDGFSFNLNTCVYAEFALITMLCRILCRCYENKTSYQHIFHSSTFPWISNKITSNFFFSLVFFSWNYPVGAPSVWQYVLNAVNGQFIRFINSVTPNVALMATMS